MSDVAESASVLPEAPAWRRRVARLIDLAIVSVVVALFVTPVIAARAHGESSSSLLGISAWMYVAVLVVLAVAWLTGRSRTPRRRPYVTAGMSIMALYPLREGRTTRLVCSRGLPETEGEKRGRAAVAVVLPLFVVGAAFLVLELIAYT